MVLTEKIDGKKTYIGGAGAILVGIGNLLYDWYRGDIKNIEFYMTWIITGWTIISARSALKKNTGL